jgi:hypothetical protein
MFEAPREPGKADAAAAAAFAQLDFEESLPCRVGDWVIHPMLGRGQIREKAGLGPEAKLTIRFDTGATKKIILKYAGLEPA